MTDSPFAGFDDVYATPVTAVKLARLIALDRAGAFAPLFDRPGGGPYGVNAGATCDTYDHPAPFASCQCGFHAVEDERDLARLGAWRPGRVRLVVEMSGRCVEHEHGWRAGHQDVVAVEVPDRCARCGDPASCLSLRRGALVSSCGQCAARPVPLDVAAACLGVPVSFASFGDASGYVVERAVRALPFAAAFVALAAAVLSVLLRRPALAAVGLGVLTVAAAVGPGVLDAVLERRNLVQAERRRLASIALPRFLFVWISLGVFLIALSTAL